MVKYPKFNDIIGNGAGPSVRVAPPPVHIAPEPEFIPLAPEEATRHGAILNLATQRRSLPDYNNSRAILHELSQRPEHINNPLLNDLDTHLDNRLHHNIPIPQQHRFFMSDILNSR